MISKTLENLNLNSENYNENEVLELFSKLVSFESISPYDKGCIDFIDMYLSEFGFKTIVRKFENGSRCVYAEIGTGDRNFCFAGHIDVVDPGDRKEWKYDPFIATIDGDVVYGSGACDMKGSVAIMLYIMKNISESHTEYLDKIKCSVLICSDEETSSISTKLMLDHIYENGHKIDFALIGEPTSVEQVGDMIKIGRRGSINFDLDVVGAQGHVAYQDLAINPNKMMVSILHDIINMKIDDGSDYFDKSNLEITSIDVGNKFTNVIPQKCSAKFNVRYSDQVDEIEIIQKVEEIVRLVTDKYELKYNVSAKPFLTKITQIHQKIANFIENNFEINVQFSTTGGTSDARFIKDYCDYLMELGFLNLTAHKKNENVRVEDFKKVYIIYTEALGIFADVAEW